MTMTAVPQATVHEPVARPPRRWPALVVALLLGLLAGAAVGAYLASRPATWTAETQLLVTPAKDLPAASLTSYYEALSRGQITATAAAIAADGKLLDSARSAAGVSAGEGLTSTASVVPDTTLVRVSVTAPSKTDAQTVTKELVAQATAELDRLIPSYDVTQLTSSTPPASKTGLSIKEVLGGAVVAFVVVAFAVYELCITLARGRRQRLHRRQPSA
jgi:capsular polysaccharide biosynthesis protein